jgi:hypothetical protein
MVVKLALVIAYQPKLLLLRKQTLKRALCVLPVNAPLCLVAMPGALVGDARRSLHTPGLEHHPGKEVLGCSSPKFLFNSREIDLGVHLAERSVGQLVKMQRKHKVAHMYFTYARKV